jgi:uncharacterized protein
VKNKLFKVLFVFIISLLFINITYAEEIKDNNTDLDTNKYNYINSTTNYKLLIEDDANLLSEEEIKKLEDKMTSLTEYGNIIFKSIDKNNHGSASSYASSYYHSNFGTESGSVLLIDMDTRNIYIFSDGYNFTIITSSKAYSITDNSYKYASDKRYYDCAYSAFDQMETILGGGKIMEPMRYVSDVVIALTLAAFINFFIIMKKSKLKVASSSEILSKCKIDFNIGDINATKTGTHRVYNPPSSSSSGGSSGGGGGGSSGGGGGHSF